MKNLCGKCNVCCLVCRIDKSEFRWRNTDKEAWEMCDKLINGRCVKYKIRPKVCKTFECLWLQISKSQKKELDPVTWRPDNLGILVKTGIWNDKFLFRVEELEKGKIDFDDANFLSFIDILFKLSKQQIKDTFIVLYYFGKDNGHQLKQK